MRCEGGATRPFVDEAGGSAYECLVVYICFSRRPSNRLILARIDVVGKLKIGHPWVREAAEGAPGTYSCIIEIQNDGDEPQRLLGAIIEGAGTGVLYKLTENNGHFTSRPFQEGLVIKPHGSVELPPTAYQSAKSEIR